MMTAEQFYHAWMGENWGSRSDLPKIKDWFNICEAYAAAQLAELTAKLPETFFVGHDLAFRLERLVDGWQRAVTANLTLEAQLAEKEREIERLTEQRDATQDSLDADYTRAETAEERLKEAQADRQHWQARYVTQQNLCWSFRDELAELRERLRQREAELEQLRAQITSERSTS